MAENTTGNTQKKTKMSGRVTVDQEICKGCSLCVSVCPRNIMALDRKTLNSKGYNPAVCTDQEQCIACGFCGIICPDSAITVEREK